MEEDKVTIKDEISTEKRSMIKYFTYTYMFTRLPLRLASILELRPIKVQYWTTWYP